MWPASATPPRNFVCMLLFMCAQLPNDGNWNGHLIFSPSPPPLPLTTTLAVATCMTKTFAARGHSSAYVRCTFACYCHTFTLICFSLATCHLGKQNSHVCRVSDCRLCRVDICWKWMLFWYSEKKAAECYRLIISTVTSIQNPNRHHAWNMCPLRGIGTAIRC